MKLHHFITESIKPEVEKYFKVHGHIEETPEGLVVDGDMENIGGRILKEVPFKIAEVTGEFSIENAKLSNLNNFPSYAGSIILHGNETLTSLAGGEHIRCEELDLSGCGISDLHGCPAALYYNFRRCANLRSTAGLNTSEGIRRIELANCLNLQNIDELSKRIGAKGGTGKSTITYNPNLNMLKLILVNGTPGYLDFEISFGSDSLDRSQKQMMSNIQNLYAEFKGKGLENSIELIRRYYNETGSITSF